KQSSVFLNQRNSGVREKKVKNWRGIWSYRLSKKAKYGIEMIGLGNAMMSSLLIDDIKCCYAIVLLVTHLFVIITLLFSIVNVCPADIMLELALQIIVVNLREGA
ncbi:hypothetical protein CCACVL1_30694, partial [Corchorus capsularis]